MMPASHHSLSHGAQIRAPVLPAVEDFLQDKVGLPFEYKALG